MTTTDRAFLSGYRICAMTSAGTWVRGSIEHYRTMTPDDWFGALVALALIAWATYRCRGDGFGADERKPMAVGFGHAVRGAHRIIP